MIDDVSVQCMIDHPFLNRFFPYIHFLRIIENDFVFFSFKRNEDGIYNFIYQIKKTVNEMK